MRFVVFLSFLITVSLAQAKLKVVTTTTDMKALVQAVAGDQADVTSIAKGTQDPHQIEAKPSFMVQLRNADLVVAQGLELETAWIQPLINGARNPKIQTAKGYVELGPELEPIEIPSGKVSRAEGDVHPGGNPHFQLDPLRMGKAAGIIAEKLTALDGAHADLYKVNAEKFAKHLAEKTAEWKKRLEKTGIKEVVSYHKTLSYFFDRFGIKNSLQLEPKPGIPPTASHLMDVIAQMKQRNIRLVLIENYFSEESEKKLKQEIPQVKVYRVAVSVDGDPGLGTTEAVIENLVKKFEEAIK
jgi:zinc/manganese transport system substrate-binding protein